MIIEILASIIVALILLVLFTLYQHGKAVAWMNNHMNTNRMRKHYGAEGININFNFFDHTIEVFFHHHSKSYAQSVSFHDAIDYMNKTPNGGIRNLLIKKLK